jgi:hypothetical protein
MRWPAAVPLPGAGRRQRQIDTIDELAKRYLDIDITSEDFTQTSNER